MMYRAIVHSLILACCLNCLGCTRQAWYDAMQERQRQECYRIQNLRDSQQCLEKVNVMGYEQYDRLRKQALERP